MIRNVFVASAICLTALACTSVSKENAVREAENGLDYCARQTERTLAQIESAGYGMSPRNIAPGDSTWNLCPVSKELWTEGFWPGVLWYDYEYTADRKILAAAEKYTEALEFISEIPAYDHDLGFIIFCSYGNGYRLTGNPEYKEVILATAEKLASLFVDQRTCGGYMRHKTGPGYGDFSEPQPLWIEPFASLRWQKPVAVLTNRRTFSAANSFAMYMHGLPGVALQHGCQLALLPGQRAHYEPPEVYAVELVVGHFHWGD